jgi:hypothetical protein
MLPSAIKHPVLVPVSAHGSAKESKFASCVRDSLHNVEKSKVLRARRSIRVTITTSPAGSRLSIRRKLAPVTFSR